MARTHLSSYDMGLFTLPPAPPRADLDLESYLHADATQTPVRRFRRMLAAEWFPQSGVQLTWPHEGTDWAPMLHDVEQCYLRLAYEIATRELLLLVTPHAARLKRQLETQLPRRATDNIIYAECPTDDTWARDHGLLSVVGTGHVELHDFLFCGWGGKFPAAQDNAINRHLAESGTVSGTYIPHKDFELEGGSIESDGRGTLLTTTRCLLNANRRHPHEKRQVELALRDFFGATNVLWLEHGALAGDDTDAHIDTLARLCPENRIAYVRCDAPTDTHYAELQAMEAQLRTFRDADGNAFELVALPLPDAIYDAGERLPATYANYLVLNRAVLMPTYGQPEKDNAARRAVLQLFPKYDVVGIDCRALIRQHGSLHCATMQFPKGVLRRQNNPSQTDEARP